MPTIDEIKNFFIGDRKFVKSTQDTPVYLEPGQAPYKTVDANDVIGKVEGVNSKGNWLKLRVDQNYNPSGGWVLVNDHMYTTILNTEAPTGPVDAVTREAKKAVTSAINATTGFVWDAMPGWLKVVLILIVVLLIIAVFVRISGTSIPLPS